MLAEIPRQAASQSRLLHGLQNLYFTQGGRIFLEEDLGLGVYLGYVGSTGKISAISQASVLARNAPFSTANSLAWRLSKPRSLPITAYDNQESIHPKKRI